MFSIGAGIRKSLGDIVVKDVKSTSLFRPKLLEKLKVSNKRLSKDRKTHFNIIVIFNTYTLIIKTKSVKSYIEGLTIKLQNLFIKLLVFKKDISKII